MGHKAQIFLIQHPEMAFKDLDTKIMNKHSFLAFK